MTLIATYAKRLMKFPACSIIKASLEKVEKVVNPPQMPTIMKSAHELFSLAFLLKNPQRSPIANQPTRFTTRVPQGNPLPAVFMKMETRYLAAPPMNLPHVCSFSLAMEITTIALCILICSHLCQYDVLLHV